MTEQEWRYEFAYRLNKMMFHRGFNQRELANLAGVDEDTLSKYITRARRPRIDILIRLCDALNCSIDCLTRFDENHLISETCMIQDGIRRI